MEEWLRRQLALEAGMSELEVEEIRDELELWLIKGWTFCQCLILCRPTGEVMRKTLELIDLQQVMALSSLGEPELAYSDYLDDYRELFHPDTRYC